MNKEILNPTNLVGETIGWFEAFSSDLKSGDLAAIYVRGLFDLIGAEAAADPDLAIKRGSQVFYAVGREVLGPIATAFTHFSLEHTGGELVVFPARDATPFYIIGKELLARNPESYPVHFSRIKNSFFNRKLWGVDDELDGGAVIDPRENLSYRFLHEEIGFGKPVTFIEAGAWGSMADMIKRCYPEQPFELLFFFSHLPEAVYGFTNQFGIPEGDLESLNDSFEALPKFCLRPTKLICPNGRVTVDFTGREISSPLVRAWYEASLLGFQDAARDFLSGKTIDPQSELERILGLGALTRRTGEFTGILPFHTMTWTEGPQWRANWPWGKIPPMGRGI